MPRALVSIGVDRVTGMTPLQAAVAGAKQVAAWARDQGFDVAEVIDEAGPVKLDRIVQAISAFVTTGIYDQIIVYFAGHGQLNSPTQEVWLLTDAMTNSNEAANVLSSASTARGWGIPHVVFISDACRSWPANRQFMFVQGGSIFPTPNPWRTNSELDLFYATAPGDPAYEVPEQDAVRGYRAIYTDCLLTALRGEVPAAIEAYPIDGADKHLVPARKLKAHLADCVPQRAAAVSIRLTQEPEARVESALPKYMAEVAAPPPSPRPPPVVVEGRRGVMEFKTFPPRVRVTKADDEVPKRTSPAAIIRDLKAEYFLRDSGVPAVVPLEGDPIRKDIERLTFTQGRESFETGTGFTVHGTDVLEFASLPPNYRFEEGGVTNVGINIRPPDEVDLREAELGILIRFNTGTGVCLAILPGYVGNISVDKDGRVESVTYTPSRRSPFFDEYRYEAEQVNRRRAFAAVASKNGAFALERRQAGDAAEYLRALKEVDPALGIYAAYAYAQAGDYEGVRSVYEYMSSQRGIRTNPVPFDVAMLAHHDRNLPRPFRFPPRMPMLTQGWALLGRHEALLPPAAIEARKHLIPSLWSTFSGEGMAILFDAMRQGAL